MSNPSMNELFADDSSDESDVGGNNNNKKENSSDDRNRKNDDEDMSDADEEESSSKKKMEEDEERNVAASTGDSQEGEEDGEGDNNNNNNSAKSNAHEYNEDDSDVEFDDADDGIVGRSSAGKPTIGENDDDGGGGDDRRRQGFSGLGIDDVGTPTGATPTATSGGDGTKAQQQQQQQQARRPRRMEVLDIPRPNNHTRPNITLHTTKLPNVVGINPEAFDPATYDAAIEEREYRGYVHNMIRWRYRKNKDNDDYNDDDDYVRDDNGKLIRESNARIVKWSDGSFTLHVGNETFEVDEVDHSVKATDDSSSTTAAASKKSAAGGKQQQQPPMIGFAGLNGYLYLSQRARHVSSSDDGLTTKEQPGGTVLECMGPVSSKMTPRPSSLQSEAHKNLTLAVRQRNIRRARIAEYVTQVDPEKEKIERIKNKDDLKKQEARGGGGRRSYGGGGRRSAGAGRAYGMNRRYLESNAAEDDANYDSVNISSLKRRTRMGDDTMDYGDDAAYGYDDDDDEEDEWSKRKKMEFKKHRQHQAAGVAGAGGGRGGAYSDDDDEEFAFGEDSSDEDAKIMKAGKKRSHQAVVDEDDEDSD